MQIPIELPNTLWGWIAIIAAVGAAWVFIRQQGIRSIYDANKELRSIVDDRGKEIDGMKEQIKELQTKVKELEKANKTLQDLVITALKQYFFENPKVAGAMKDLVTPV